MSTQYVLTAQARTELGKGATRRLRRLKQQIPAVIYGGDQTPTSIMLNEIEVNKSLKNEGIYAQVLTLDLEGQQHSVIIKAIQRHPAKSSVTHMDFMRVDAAQAITIRVPLRFLGEDVAPGVKQHGGLVSHLMTEVEIKCLPAHLPECIEVDISQLGIEQSLHLSDLVLPEQVELPTLAQGHEHDLPVISIHKAKGHEDAAASDETATDGAS